VACGGKSQRPVGTFHQNPSPSGSGAVADGGADAMSGSGGDTSTAGSLATGGAPADLADAGAGGQGGAPLEPHPYRALQVATGTDHTCALLEDHRVKCWGINLQGQLGLGDTVARGIDPTKMGDALPFVDLGTGRTAKQIAAGYRMSCALLDDDSVKCWGRSLFTAHQAPTLMYGDAPNEMGDALPLVASPDGHRATSVAVGHFSACAALEDESFWCGSAQTDAGLTPAVATPHLSGILGSGNVLALFDDHSARAVLTDSHLVAFVIDGVRLAAASVHYYCFVLSDDTARCTGDQGFTLSQTLPDAQALGVTSEGVLCTLDQASGVRCWGNLPPDQPWQPNADGYVTIPLAQPAVQLASAGEEHQCALLADGSISCWSFSKTSVAATGSAATGADQLAPVDLGMWTP
jgi:hypothetical protein